MIKTVLLAPADHHRAALDRARHDARVEVVPLDDSTPLPDWSDYSPGEVDLLLGAPRIYVDDEANSDDEEFVQAVRDLQPDVFILETVRGLASPKYEGFLHDLMDDLADRNYRVGWNLIRVGKARRVLIVGVRERLEVLPYVGPYLDTTIRENLNRVSLVNA